MMKLDQMWRTILSFPRVAAQAGAMLLVMLALNARVDPAQAASQAQRRLELLIYPSKTEEICPGMAFTIQVMGGEVIPFENQTGPGEVSQVTVGNGTISVAGASVGVISPLSVEVRPRRPLATFNYFALRPGTERLTFTAQMYFPETRERVTIVQPFSLTVRECSYEVDLYYSQSWPMIKTTGYSETVRLTSQIGGIYSASAPFTVKMMLESPGCSVHVGDATSTASFSGIQTNEAFQLTVMFQSVVLTASGTCPDGSATVSFPWDLAQLGPATFSIPLADLSTPLGGVFVESPPPPPSGADGGTMVANGYFTLLVRRIVR